MHERAAGLIRSLDLEPHPEGGYYRRTYASTKQVHANGLRRPALTSISFLLLDGAASRWHRVDASEVWDWQEGSAMELRTFDPHTRTLSRTQLDTSARGGQLLQVVPAGVWQSARSHGSYTLVNCTVSPGFMWSALEMLDEDSAMGQDLRAAGGLAS